MRNYDILFDRTERNIHFTKADCLKNYDKNFFNMDFNQSSEANNNTSDKTTSLNSINLQNNSNNEIDNNSNSDILTKLQEEPKNLSNSSLEQQPSINSSMENNLSQNQINEKKITNNNITNENNNDSFTGKEINTVNESAPQENQSKI